MNTGGLLQLGCGRAEPCRVGGEMVAGTGAVRTLHWAIIIIIIHSPSLPSLSPFYFTSYVHSLPSFLTSRAIVTSERLTVLSPNQKRPRQASGRSG